MGQVLQYELNEKLLKVSNMTKALLNFKTKPLIGVLAPMICLISWNTAGLGQNLTVFLKAAQIQMGRWCYLTHTYLVSLWIILPGA